MTTKTNINLIVNGTKVYTRSSSKVYGWAVVRYAYRKASSKVACLGITNLSNDLHSIEQAAANGSRCSNVTYAFLPGVSPAYMICEVIDNTVTITEADMARLMHGAA